jgi:hypothetical protein
MSDRPYPNEADPQSQAERDAPSAAEREAYGRVWSEGRERRARLLDLDAPSQMTGSEDEPLVKLIVLPPGMTPADDV